MKAEIQNGIQETWIYVPSKQQTSKIACSPSKPCIHTVLCLCWEISVGICMNATVAERELIGRIFFLNGKKNTYELVPTTLGIIQKIALSYCAPVELACSSSPCPCATRSLNLLVASEAAIQRLQGGAKTSVSIHDLLLDGHWSLGASLYSLRCWFRWNYNLDSAKRRQTVVGWGQKACRPRVRMSLSTILPHWKPNAQHVIRCSWVYLALRFLCIVNMDWGPKSYVRGILQTLNPCPVRFLVFSFFAKGSNR